MRYKTQGVGMDQNLTRFRGMNIHSKFLSHSHVANLAEPRLPGPLMNVKSPPAKQSGPEGRGCCPFSQEPFFRAPFFVEEPEITCQIFHSNSRRPAFGCLAGGSMAGW